MITRQSTARTILVGPVLDSTGAAKTDEVIGNIKITKNGTVGAADGSATLTHDHAGKYKLALTANDCDTVGVLEISLNSGTNDMPVKGLNVVETAIWDALFADGATGLLPANVTQFGGANLTAASGIPEVRVASMADNTLTAAAIAPDAGAELAALVETYIVNEGDATAVLQAVADKIAQDWIAGDASPVAVATAVWSVATRTITGGSLTTSPPTAGQVADAVWDEARSGHVTAGTFGEKVNAELDSSVTAILNDIPTTAEFEARTLAAASYATASQINSLQVNTRASVQVPVEIETPDSGTQVWKVRLFLFDSNGNMEAPDSTPTVALVNASGTDRSSRLSAATTLSTGAYSWDYTSTDDDAEEQLNWTFTVVEGGLTRIYPAMSYVVEETAYRFTSTDRATLNSRASQSSVDDIPTNAELATALSSKASTSDVTTVGTAVAAVSTKLGSPAGVSVSADIASIKTDTGTTIPGLFTTLTTKIRKFFQLALRKDAAIATDNATELTELNASGGSGAGAYSNITDAQEAIRDRGDAAWTTGGGGGGGGGESLMLSTTIATVTSQTVLILTDGTGENDAYKDMMVIVTDQATANQKSRAMVASYVGSSKTLTLSAACTFTVAVGDTVYIVAVSGRTTEFTGTALAKLNAVQAAVVMQTGATGYSVVRPGGKIVLKAGDDYADDIITTISLPVTDADEVVYDRLTAGDTATIKFAAGRNRQKNLIVGTITKADVTKAAGVTYVPIEIARAQLVASTDPSTNRVFNDYKYDIQVTTSGGKVTTPVGGELEVEFDNAE